MKDKVVIVTGASSGIGRAVAIEFAKHKSIIVLAGRNEHELNETKRAIETYGVKSLISVTDVTNKYECQKLIDKTILSFDSIDILINNAGISMRALFEQTDLKVIEELMNVNFWGSVYCTKFALPHIISSQGSIAVVSSIAGYKGLPGRTGYSASKFALHGFFEALRSEMRRKNVHVLIACPGYTTSKIRERALIANGSQQGKTPREEEKLMSAEKVAECIYYAIKNRKRTLTLTTEGKLVVWLNKFFPSWVDTMVYNSIAKEPDSPFK